MPLKALKTRKRLNKAPPPPPQLQPASTHALADLNELVELNKDTRLAPSTESVISAAPTKDTIDKTLTP